MRFTLNIPTITWENAEESDIALHVASVLMESIDPHAQTADTLTGQLDDVVTHIVTDFAGDQDNEHSCSIDGVGGVEVFTAHILDEPVYIALTWRTTEQMEHPSIIVPDTDIRVGMSPAVRSRLEEKINIYRVGKE